MRGARWSPSGGPQWEPNQSEDEASAIYIAFVLRITTVSKVTNTINSSPSRSLRLGMRVLPWQPLQCTCIRQSTVGRAIYSYFRVRNNQHKLWTLHIGSMHVSYYVKPLICTMSRILLLNTVDKNPRVVNGVYIVSTYLVSTHVVFNYYY